MLVVFVASAVAFDVRTYRIPNLLNGIGCVAGMLSQIFRNGMQGMLGGLTGMFIPVGVLFVLFMFRIVGAGDIKMLAMIGSFVCVDVWIIMVLAFLITAVYGVFILIRNSMTEEKNGLTKIHLSIPIALGTLIFMIGGVVIGL